MPEPVVSFDLTQDALNEINRASSVMQLPDLVVRSEGTTIVMVALDRQVLDLHLHRVGRQRPALAVQLDAVPPGPGRNLRGSRSGSSAR